MAAIPVLHVGDIGTQFVVQVRDEGSAVVNLATATTLQIILKPVPVPPTGAAAKTFTATLFTDGTDGKIQYTTAAASDLDVGGTWFIEGRVVIGSNDWKTQPGKFNVTPSL